MFKGKLTSDTVDVRTLKLTAAELLYLRRLTGLSNNQAALTKYLKYTGWISHDLDDVNRWQLPIAARVERLKLNASTVKWSSQRAYN